MKICDVGDPYLIRPRGHQILYQIGIRAHAMARECGALVAQPTAHQQTGVAHDVEQAVTAHGDAVVTLEHHFKLAHAHLRMALAHTAYDLQYPINLNC